MLVDVHSIRPCHFYHCVDWSTGSEVQSSLVGDWGKVLLFTPYCRIIETADNYIVGCAPFFVRQAALPAGSDKMHPLFIRAMDSAFHGSLPCGSECSELLLSTIMEKNVTESQIPDI